MSTSGGDLHPGGCLDHCAEPATGELRTDDVVVRRGHLVGRDPPNYTIAYTSVAGDFVVTQAPLTITASSSSMPYATGHRRRSHRATWA